MALSFYCDFLIPSALCLATLLLMRKWRNDNKYRMLPPGPPPGLLGLGDNRAHITCLKGHMCNIYTEWAKKYGPIFSYHLGETPVIVLGSSAKIAWDLLEKRGDIYSSRPRLIMANELLARCMRGGISPYGERWKKWRKIHHIGMSGRQAVTYQQFQALECSLLMRDIMNDADSYVRHLQRFATSIALSVSYGTRIKSLDQQLVTDNIRAITVSDSYMVSGAYMVESYPILLKLPRFLQWFRHEPDRLHKWIGDFYLTLFRGVAAKMRNGTAMESSSSRALSPGKNMGMTEVELAWAVSSPFQAGIETTQSTLVVFILAMLHYPQVAKKAREEIDRVVGRDKMPVFDDEKSLPYTAAMIKEVLRWKAVVPTGLPHSVTEDDYYNGFFIPKGATIYANIHGMTRDSEFFSDPDIFKPERFLETNEPRLVEFNLPFGFGRRICPGQHVASQSLFIAITRLLWAFDIEPAVGADGKHVLPDPNAFKGTLVIQPVPFKCQFIPRTPEVEILVNAEASNADIELTAWD